MKLISQIVFFQSSYWMDLCLHSQLERHEWGSDIGLEELHIDSCLTALITLRRTVLYSDSVENCRSFPVTGISIVMGSMALLQ